MRVVMPHYRSLCPIIPWSQAVRYLEQMDTNGGRIMRRRPLPRITIIWDATFPAHSMLPMIEVFTAVLAGEKFVLMDRSWSACLGP